MLDSMQRMRADEPLAAALVSSIQGGDVARLKELLAEHPGIAKLRVEAVSCQPGPGVRTLLHIATDWPGNLPNAVATVKCLLAAGADIDGPFIGRHSETALHWTASNDDVDLLDTLLDAGADIEAGGGVIGNGTPLADAVAFGQWRAAYRLAERGAKANLWQAAALGFMGRLEELMNEGPPVNDVTNAFWCACHGGQKETAAYLLERGADLNGVGHDNLTPLDAARRSEASEDLLGWLVERGANSASG
jgi:hypothetical protein